MVSGPQNYLESQVDQNKRPLYPKLAHKSAKEAHNYGLPSEAPGCEQSRSLFVGLSQKSRVSVLRHACKKILIEFRGPPCKDANFWKLPACRAGGGLCFCRICCGTEPASISFAFTSLSMTLNVVLASIEILVRVLLPSTTRAAVTQPAP